MADAYRVKQDTTFQRPLRTVTTIDGQTIEETQGVAYREGDYVLLDELTERDRERADSGELEDFLEEASTDDVESARAAAAGVFIPEHEVERVALIEDGKRVVEKDQLLELRAAGAEGAKAYLEESYDGPDDNNDALTSQKSFVEVSDIATSQSEGQPVLPGEGKQDEISDEDLLAASSSSVAGVEMPPGIPVGPTLAAASGQDVDTEPSASTRSSRRPAKRASSRTTSESTGTPTSTGQGGSSGGSSSSS
jgi:hypothetical protein